MVVIEKYDPAKVFTVVHFDGKSKNYLVKRFTFDSSSIGKQTSIISDEHGSKMVFITGDAKPLVKVEQLKGKEQTRETVELDLSALIDVKGIKAMGNRLTQHVIKTVELIPEALQDNQAVRLVENSSVETAEMPGEKELVTDETPEAAMIVLQEEPESEPLIEEIPIAEKPTETAKETGRPPIKKSLKPVNKEQIPTNPDQPIEQSTPEPLEPAVLQAVKPPETGPAEPPKTEQPLPKPLKKIELEITNPDEIKIDKKGQLGLF